MKFRLLEKSGPNKVGPHYVGDKVYLPGSVIESDRPLDVQFKGKFERAPEDAPVTEPLATDFAGMFIKAPSQDVALQGGGQKNPPAGPLSTPKEFLGEAVTVHGRKDATSVAPKPTTGKTIHGVDVTDEFPTADLSNVRVYRDLKKKLFSVVDPDTDTVLKKAASEKVVSKFLKDQLG
jgi:hypothetical protein